LDGLRLWSKCGILGQIASSQAPRNDAYVPLIYIK
jgi:hypothetical protein